jgi:hypothetical protein
MESIESLIQKIKSYYPISISMLIAHFNQGEELIIFLEMVDEYIPDSKRDILNENDVGNQIAIFANAFEDKYFPLWYHLQEGESESYQELTFQIPLVYRGFTSDDYDELISEDSGYLGNQIMTFFFDTNETGRRAALYDCFDSVIREQFKRIPEEGYTNIADLKMLEKTDYEPLLLWGKKLYQETGNEFFDISDEDAGYNNQYPDWSRENVDYYTKAWKNFLKLDKKVSDFAAKLQNNPHEMLEEIIDFLVGKDLTDQQFENRKNIGARQLVLAGFEENAKEN